MKQYTKDALASTLKELAKTKPIDKITVTELVEACDIKRQTFYYHFQDIYDLVSWIYLTEALKTIENKRSYSTWQEGLDSILQYVEDNKDFCINTYRSLGREHLELFLERVSNDLLGGVIDEITADHPIDDVSKNFIVKFYSFAFVGILLDWIRSNLKAPHQVISQNIVKIMEGNFQRAIQNTYE